MKEQTMTSIDSELKKIAKDKNWSLSEVLEKALRHKLTQKEAIIEEANQCQYCGQEGKKEIASDVARETNTKDDVQNPHNLVWLYPDEKWICNKCLRTKTERMQTY